MSGWTSVDIEEHLPRLRGYARALTRDAGAADDLVQEALLRAYERASTYRPGHSLRSWLLSILHNLFIDQKRREASEARRDARLSELADGMVGQAEQEQAIYIGEIAARFEALPDDHRTVLSLIGIQGLSYQETAAVVGVPVGTVMSRLHRARTALREPEAQVARLQIVGGKHAS